MSKEFYQALHDLAPHIPGRIHFDEDGDIRAEYRGEARHPVHGPVGAALLLATLIEAVEERRLNWRISRQGRNPDNTWQYWAELWHPTRSRPNVARLGSSPEEALTYVLLDVS